MTQEPSDRCQVSQGNHIDAHVDDEIASYLNPASPRSFFLFAGAGSGKTRSLVTALNFIGKNYGYELNSRGQKVGVITFTNAASDEIKGRIDFTPLFHVSTIHSFAWTLIKGFHHDIREWLHTHLSTKILNDEEKEKTGRPGSAASIGRQANIAFNRNRLDNLDSVRSFSYDPTGNNSDTNALNHTDVISIFTQFLSDKPMMGWVLVGRFPFLLIDECQDTDGQLIDALFRVEKEHSGRFSLGLIGDLMQRIYQNGKDRIDHAIPDQWGRSSKKLNHRCPKRVVALINKIRMGVDCHIQQPGLNAKPGHARLFIVPAGTTNRDEYEDKIRAQMAVCSDDSAWIDHEQCKILTLEHHMSAKRLGFHTIFDSLDKIPNYRAGLLDGSPPELQFFCRKIWAIVKEYNAGDKFKVSQLVYEASPLLTPEALTVNPRARQEQAKRGIDCLMALWNKTEPNCGDVLRTVAAHGLLKIPGSLQAACAILENATNTFDDDDKADPISERAESILSFLKAPFSEIDNYQKYINGLAAFGTHQGIKGLEFDRVMVILDDTEARGFLFQYGKLFGDRGLSATDQKKIADGNDNSIDRTRRLLYVTCSRAQSSLALVIYAENPADVKKHVIETGWFADSEIVTVVPR